MVWSTKPFPRRDEHTITLALGGRAAQNRLHYAVAGTPNRLEYDQGFFVKGGDGDGRSVTLLPVPGRPGSYSGLFVPWALGPSQLSVELPGVRFSRIGMCIEVHEAKRTVAVHPREAGPVPEGD